ncbi:isoleucine--tRNA ligase [Lysinibacillus irui]|uniref:Isoleucine--tRNA ligase n=1 Tax=Lysinibacillus irui TaxID=2998077 RepID=A0ABU5NHQ1_9BACI|nr:isoleucine--tRNA ligase [Lysinibacillus irui]MEA0552994.1 isoleucine--tRNA ligase [Lysinibacillus irui]MEA0975574.1 isoleucine--tRNA ligase [Lysinibacillus irui]MEA1041728.1 isoleucine--tRNA ligase [Lysinibacillus irui]
MQVEQKKETTVERETRIRALWEQEDTFEKSVTNRAGQQPFVFYEGPPTANGLPHVGHAFGRTIKDVVARYKTMQGFFVERKAGWDTHGLPVELGVEKTLGISGKQEIENYGVERFIQACKNSVFTYEQKWRSFTEQLGYWLDMDDPYLTLSNDYIESVWHILSHVHKENRLYKGHRVSPYCPSCQTSLSSHEVAQGYKDIKDLSVTAMFKRQDHDEYFLGWTTTPWTLPANVALAMNPALKYVRVKHANNIYILAKSLVTKVFSEPVEIVSEHDGHEFAGVSYHPPFSYVKVDKGHVVVMADYVTEHSGTGIVHIAPAYGEDDYKTVQHHGLSFINVVDLKGCYTDEVPELVGRFVKDCDVDIIKMLAKKELLFAKEKYEHSYPHCWRCDSPLLYYATDSWFIKMSSLKEQLLQNNQQVTWYPGHIKDGRFGNFLENLVDWNISRNRYWGTPLNVWVCQGCGHEEAPNSIAALIKLAKGAVDEQIELHKPFIDDIVCTCPHCQGDMKRTPEVIDVWFDSGSMPFAQQHYPFEDVATFHNQFPADVVIEGIDQTRGFFYSLLAVSTLFTGKPPYKNVLSLGHVLDEHGQKMSKSKGNALEPVELIEQYGADALRWAFLVDSSPWNPKRFSKKIVMDAKSKLVDTLDHTFKFYEMYATIDGFTYDASNTGTRSHLDHWILSRLHHTIQVVTAAMDDYQFTQATREIAQLVEELSNWYIRRSRARFWANGLTVDKRGAFSTLYELLTSICQLLAPFTPFIAEDIYRQLCGKSVHLENYPICNEQLMDVRLEQEMAMVLTIVELGRSIRNSQGMKVKQPLSELIVAVNGELADYQVYNELIQDELNIKFCRWTHDFSAYERVYYKLNFKTAGAAFGSKVNQVKDYLTTLTNEEKNKLQQQGALDIVIEDQQLTLLSTHVVAESVVKEHYIKAEDSTCRVLLNVQLTESLLQEGQMRELIRTIQDARKKWQLPVEQYVSIAFNGSSEVLSIIQQHETLLQANVLVKALHYGVEWHEETSIDTALFNEKLTIFVAL